MTKAKTATAGPTQQVCVRLANELAAQLDDVALALSRPGLEVNRTDAARAAIVRGLSELQAELGIKAPKPKR